MTAPFAGGYDARAASYSASVTCAPQAALLPSSPTSSIARWVTLTFETMQLTADTGLTMAVYTAEPGSKSEQALNLLASWTATAEQAETTPAID